MENTADCILSGAFPMNHLYSWKSHRPPMKKSNLSHNALVQRDHADLIPIMHSIASMKVMKLFSQISKVMVIGMWFSVYSLHCVSF